jgi:hypothetical protein
MRLDHPRPQARQIMTANISMPSQASREPIRATGRKPLLPVSSKAARPLVIDG